MIPSTNPAKNNVPGGQQDQGHDVVLWKVINIKQSISFRNEISKIGMYIRVTIGCPCPKTLTRIIVFDGHKLTVNVI